MELSIKVNGNLSEERSRLEVDPKLSAGCSGIPSSDPDDETMTPEDASNLIIEQNIVCLSDEVQEAISSDLCGALAPGEQLSIIVGDDVGDLTRDDWQTATQDLALPACYFYQCDGNTYRISTDSPLTLGDVHVPVPKPVQKSHICQFAGCGRQFSSVGYLKIHQLIHNGQKTECPYGCGKSFSRPAHLKYHQMTHTGKRPYCCSYDGCGRSFYTNQRLIVHNRLHTGERPFICQFDNCLKSFTTAGNLKNHARTHSGEKPFACDVEGCAKKFAEYSSLKKHKVIHSGDKPYICEECGQLFTQSGSRNVHMRRHQYKPPDMPILVAALADSFTHPTSLVSSNVNDITTNSAAEEDLAVTNDITMAVTGAGGKDDILSSGVDSSTFIIVSGTKEDLIQSDEVVTVSTQPESFYRDTLDLPRTVLSHAGEQVTEKVIVKSQIMSPEVILPPFC